MTTLAAYLAWESGLPQSVTVMDGTRCAHFR